MKQLKVKTKDVPISKAAKVGNKAAKVVKTDNFCEKHSKSNLAII
jgi:hypothetical protein